MGPERSPPEAEEWEIRQVILDDPPIGGKFRDGPVRAFFTTNVGLVV